MARFSHDDCDLGGFLNEAKGNDPREMCRKMASGVFVGSRSECAMSRAEEMP
jgi:hypothetical protein